MKLIRINKKWNKVSTKKELEESLRKYESILNNSVEDYLKSLIELDCSVINTKVSKEALKLLSELDLYRDIAIYNIYNRTLNLFKDENDLIISGNNDGIEGLSIYSDSFEDRINIFDFDYRKSNKTSIGEIDLYKSIEDEKFRKEKLDGIMRVLETLYDAKNPYYDAPGSFGGPSSRWYYDNQKRIEEYEKMFDKLDRKEITEQEKKEIELTEKYHELLLKEFNLKNKKFKEEKTSDTGSSCMNKKLVKEYPGLKINDNISYI